MPRDRLPVSGDRTGRPPVPRSRRGFAAAGRSSGRHQVLQAAQATAGAGGRAGFRAAGDGRPAKRDHSGSVTTPLCNSATLSGRARSRHMKVPLLDLKSQYRSIKAEVDAAIAEVMEYKHFILGPTVERLG